MGRRDSYAVRRTLDVNGRSYGYYSLAAAEAAGLGPVSRLPEDFNSFAARRVHYEVLIRGTFANIRLKNEMAPVPQGGSPATWRMES